MQYINIENLIAIEDLKSNPTSVLKFVDRKGQIVILRNNKPTYIISKYDSQTSDKSILAQCPELKLHEAMRIVLEEQPEKQMAAKELADEIYGRNLYLKRNGTKAQPNQISARSKKYVDLFELLPTKIIKLKMNKACLDNANTENIPVFISFQTDNRGFLLIDEIDAPMHLLSFPRIQTKHKSVPPIRYIIINEKRYYFTLDFDLAIGKFGNNNEVRNSRLLKENALSPSEFIIIKGKKFKSKNSLNTPEARFGTDLWLKKRIELEVSILKHGYNRKRFNLAQSPDSSGWNEELKFFYNFASGLPNS